MDQAKYVALFLSESRELLQGANRLLLGWEEQPQSREPVAELFRAFHSLKGMAATVGFSAVGDLAHDAETLLAAVRDGTVPPAPAVVQLLFRAVDALEAGVAAAAQGRDEAGDGSLRFALLCAAGMAGGGSAEPAASAPAAVAAPVPVSEAVPAAAGPVRARTVEVVIRPDAMMRGARALLALMRAEMQGTVTALEPPRAAFERDDFDGQFRFRFSGTASDAALEAELRAAGEVVAVRIAEMAPVAERANGDRSVRVALGRLDALTDGASELVVAKNRLAELAARLGHAELLDVAGRLDRLVGDMHAQVLAVRMAPVAELFDRFPRIVRDVARAQGKRVRFVVEGGDIELDRAVLDLVAEPLVHLLRNAVDHGLEDPAGRQAAGKPADGKLVLAARRERNVVAITVSDDGRGIDRATVLRKAQAEGLVDAGITELSNAHLLRLISRAGFSTATAVSEVSGHGVRLDVVATRPRQIGGSVELAGTRGAGTMFMLRVPLTLAVVRVLLAGVGAERYAIPAAFIAETVHADERTRTSVRETEALVVRDRAVPTVHLGELLAVPGAGRRAKMPAVVLDVAGRRGAVLVDTLLGQQDIVVEPFDAPAGMPPVVGGATILADGAPVLILDAPALV